MQQLLLTLQARVFLQLLYGLNSEAIGGEEKEFVHSIESAVALHNQTELTKTTDKARVTGILSNESSDTKSIFTAHLALNTIEKYKYATEPGHYSPIYQHFLDSLLPESDRDLRMAIVTGATSRNSEEVESTAMVHLDQLSELHLSKERINTSQLL